MTKISFIKLPLAVLVIVLSGGFALAQTSAFTFQGKLNDGGIPANGQYDFIFNLFDAPSGGFPFVTLVALNDVQVTNGVFTVNLDFGSLAFTSRSINYLEISVRPGASTGSYTTLAPRQLITTSPYSINTMNLGGISASGFIQNTTSQQSSSNFNISGNGIIGGNLGLGISPAGVKLDAAGRIRLRQLTGDITGNNSAGMWLFQNTPNADRAFIGMQNDDYVGFYGSVGGWGLVMNTQNGNVGIGTVTPSSKLFVNGTGGIRATVNSDSNAGLGLMLNNQPKWSVATVSPGQFQIYNDAIGANAFWIDPTNNNVGIGTTSPNDKLEVSGFGVVRARINSDSDARLTFSVNSIPKWTVQSKNYSNGNFLSIVNESTGTSVIDIHPNNDIEIQTFAQGGNTVVCQYFGTLAYCSSSLRYKTNIAPFGSGLNLVKQLSPITFNWKQDGMKDFGLGAEDVEKIEPLLVTYNDKGEVEGVKYERIGVVLINAVKEQQTQIEQQQKQIEQQQDLIKQQAEKLERQQSEIDALKAVVCSQNQTAAICQLKK
jgi:hypothetical protein